MKRYILSSVMTVLLAVMTATAHDFSATISGQRIYFNITDTLKKTVEVTYKGGISDHATSDLQKSLTIPGTVLHHNQVYTVTAIGAKAFSKEAHLEAVVLPSTIQKIGDFAFEHCSQLRSVVFPSTKPTLGQGTFFMCTSLQEISLGSDWTQVDFSMFRWSDSLRVVTIPSKMTRIQGLKTLRSLASVSVDSNNASYSALDGVLYDKQMSRLLCVPRAFEGSLVVPEGVKEVMWGSAIDCPAITEVDFPSSLTVISFRELSRMSGLKSITMRSDSLISTATLGGSETTLFMVSNPNCELIVPKKMVKTYRKALALSEADYTEIASQKPQGISDTAATIPYHVRKDQMINVKNIKSISNK